MFGAAWLASAVLMMQQIETVAEAGPEQIDVLVMFGNSGFQPHAETFKGHARLFGATSQIMGLEDPRPLFVESSLGGRDDECCTGIDSNTVVYYVGHGGPGAWTVPESPTVTLSEVQLGDSRIRYLWMESCNTLAHGTPPYKYPHEFDPAVRDAENVFARWGRRYAHKSAPATTPLTSALRMACGGSTSLSPPTSVTLRGLWERIARREPLSDSFILSNRRGGGVALCITRGRKRPGDTPLYDDAFTTKPNAVGGGNRLFIQYSVPRTVDSLGLALESLGTNNVESSTELGDPPPAAPILELRPLPLPQPLVQAFLEEGASERLGFRSMPLPRVLEILGAAWAEGPATSSGPVADYTLFVHPCSGGAFLRGKEVQPRRLEGLPDPETVEAPGLESSAAAQSIANLLKAAVDTARTSRRMTSSSRADMYIDGVPTVIVSGGGSRRDIVRFVKSHTAEISLGVDVAGTTYPVIGEGGRAIVEIGPRGEPLAGAVAARSIAGCRNEPTCQTKFPILDRSEARRRALIEARQAGYSDGEPSLDWGYLEAPASCYQREMGIVYRFTFEAAPGEGGGQFVVDVPAQDVAPWVCYGDDPSGTAGDLPIGCTPGGS